MNGSLADVTLSELPNPDDSLAEAAIYSEQPTSTTNDSELSTSAITEDPGDTITYTPKKILTLQKKKYVNY